MVIWGQDWWDEWMDEWARIYYFEGWWYPPAQFVIWVGYEPGVKILGHPAHIYDFQPNTYGHDNPYMTVRLQRAADTLCFVGTTA